MRKHEYESNVYYSIEYTDEKEHEAETRTGRPRRDDLVNIGVGVMYHHIMPVLTHCSGECSLFLPQPPDLTERESV